MTAYDILKHCCVTFKNSEVKKKGKVMKAFWFQAHFKDK